MHLGYIELEKVCTSLIWNLEHRLLTRWLPITIIPVAMCTISRNKFKRHYLKNKRLFGQFFIAFLKCACNLEHFEKKDEYPSLIISEIMDCERGGHLNG